MNRIVLVPAGIARMVAICPAEVVEADAALRETEVGTSEMLPADDALAAEGRSLMVESRERAVILSSQKSIFDFASRIDEAVSWAHDERLLGVAREIDGSVADLDECEICYLALRLTQGFYPKLLRRAALMISDLQWSLLSDLPPGIEPPLRTVGQMQRAMRQASLSAVALLMPRVDRVTTLVVASAVLTFFPHDEVMRALAQVTEHLDGPDLFLVASEVARRLPDTYGYHLYPRRPAYYESCIQYLIDVLPRLPLEQRAIIAFRLIECAYMSDEGEQRLRPVIPFPNKKALMRHYFTADERAELKRLGLHDVVAAELSRLGEE
jgi:hypothetical protein